VDDIDKKILHILRADARTPITSLAKRVGRSRTAVQARVTHLQNTGVILRYTIQESTQGTQAETGAVVLVSVAVRSDSNGLVKVFKAIPEVSSCLSVAGEASFALLVSRTSSERLKDVVEEIFNASGVTKTETVISLSTDF
jgi:Lrp/AsnC family leucine-responsive transcriptional regulator